VFWLIFLAAFFALFVVMVWRMSSGPSNEEPAIGNNLPGPTNTYSQFGPFPLSTGGPELGTPESLVSGDPEKELERLLHHRRWDEEQRHREHLRRDG
jgi:hypothetical protein